MVEPRLRELWWAHPARFLGLVLLPVALLIVAVASPVISHNGHGYYAPNFISLPYLLLYVLALVLMIGGAWIGSQGRAPDRVFEFRPVALDVLFWIAFAAYTVWYGPILLKNPALVIGTLTGQAGATFALREANLTVSGVTTLTQFGLAYVAIYSVTRFLLHRQMPRRHTVYLFALFGLALFRATASSERVAFLELFFGLVVTFGCSLYSRRNRFVSLGCRVFPVATFLGAPVFFALFEYNRSWISFYQYRFSNLFAFAFERLLIYYVTALNNISGAMQVMEWPSWQGELTMSWLYRAPGFSSLLTIAAEKYNEYSNFLKEYAHPEFNNATGTLIVFHDWGLVGGSLVLLASGLLIGRSYLSFSHARGFMMYMYPILFYSMYECLRIGYLYDGRCVSALGGIVIFAGLFGHWLPASSAATVTAVPAPEARPRAALRPVTGAAG